MGVSDDRHQMMKHFCLHYGALCYMIFYICARIMAFMAFIK